MATLVASMGGALSAITTGISMVSSVIGGAIQARGAQQEAAAIAQQSADQARSMKKKGDEEFAIGQRKMLETRKEKELVLSRQRAVAAASGGSATDATVTAIMGKTEQRGEYAAMLDMYNGVIARNDLYRSARDTIKSGQNALKAGGIKATSHIYSGFTDALSAFP